MNAEYPTERISRSNVELCMRTKDHYQTVASDIFYMHNEADAEF